MRTQSFVDLLGIEFNFDNKYMMKTVKYGQNKFNVYTKDAIKTLFININFQVKL